jgi:nitrite reductase/ring-hydroxylating ferredoxin subunit
LGGDSSRECPTGFAVYKLSSGQFLVAPAGCDEEGGALKEWRGLVKGLRAAEKQGGVHALTRHK